VLLLLSSGGSDLLLSLSCCGGQARAHGSAARAAAQGPKNFGAPNFGVSLYILV
jgi:hypothetical protein